MPDLKVVIRCNGNVIGDTFIGDEPFVFSKENALMVYDTIKFSQEQEGASVPVYCENGSANYRRMFFNSSLHGGINLCILDKNYSESVPWWS